MSGDPLGLGRDRLGDKAACVRIDKKDFQRLWSFREIPLTPP